MKDKRPFNKEAYDSMDMPSKVALREMMKSKGYELVGDINKEEYKKYDLMFKQGDEEVTFEIEMRKPFDLIKANYDTVHIPIRKENNQSDWYIVWNIGCTEFALIETAKIRAHAKGDGLAYIECNEGTDWNYKENFIDVPKDEWEFFKKSGTDWVKEDMSKIKRIDRVAYNPDRIKELLNKKK